MRVGVFDIGYANFAFAVEEYRNRDVKMLQQAYSKLPKKEKIIERRQHSILLRTILYKFYGQGSTVHLDLVNLNKGEKIGLQNSTRRHLSEYLATKKEILSTCDYILIEQQFKTGGACNFDAILLGESTYSWCVFNLKDIEISYTPSRYKTCILGCPRSIIDIKENGLRIARDIKKSDRKKWSKQMAIMILTRRKDTDHISYIETRKGDDVSDCILMSLAWLLKTFVMD